MKAEFGAIEGRSHHTCKECQKKICEQFPEDFLRCSSCDHDICEDCSSKFTIDVFNGSIDYFDNQRYYWKQIRYVNEKYEPFDANELPSTAHATLIADKLTGTEIYGNNSMSDKPWGIKFNDDQFTKVKIEFNQGLSVKVFKRDDPKLLEEWAKLIKGTDAGGAKAYIYLKDITKEVESFKDVEIIGECTKIWPAHPED